MLKIKNERDATLRNAAQRALMIVYGPLYFSYSSDLYLSDECSIVYLSSIGCFGKEWVEIIDKVYPSSYLNSALFVFLEIDEKERKKRKRNRNRNRNKKNNASLKSNNHSKFKIRQNEKKDINTAERVEAFAFWKKYLNMRGFNVLTIDVTNLSAEISASRIAKMLST
ncbi:hypothetical protein [Rhodohalobacter sp. SW132]|nr:hypothetical protein [Rhodohalobacter sp. SW132]